MLIIVRNRLACQGPPETFCCPSRDKPITLPPVVCIQKWPIRSKSDGFANFVQRNMRCNCAQRQQHSRPSAASTYNHYPITNWPQRSFHRGGGDASEGFHPVHDRRCHQVDARKRRFPLMIFTRFASVTALDLALVEASISVASRPL